MLPLVLNPATAKIGLIGAGEGLVRRRALLIEAGVSPVELAEEGPLDGLGILFVAGLAPDTARALAARARAAGLLVNVEDVPELCDFHVPALIRRGDLLLTVSTGGRAPGLSRLLREWLDRAFGPEWRARMDEVSAARAAWRAEGLAPDGVSQRTRDLVAAKGWLP
jgi:precorrin-2 dehydrogenase / sirohydrochlorin ferrochelatase